MGAPVSTANGTITLVNARTGRSEERSPDSVVSDISSGRYLDPGSLPTSSGDTDVYQSTREIADNPNAVVTAGSVGALRSGREVREEQHDTFGSRARSALGGASDALSLGLVSPWKDDQEFHPNYATGGRIGGIAASLLVPGAGEENLARVGAEGAEAAAGARGIGSAVGRVLEYTPLGAANRFGEAAGGLVGGEGALARVTRSGIIGAAGGGAIGAGTELSRQLLDSDTGFSGENLLGATLRGAAFGGAIGGAGSAISEGLSGLGSRTERAAVDGLDSESSILRSSSRPPKAYEDFSDPTRGPLAPNLNPRNVTLVDAAASRSRDLQALSTRIEELQASPQLARSAGIDPIYLKQAGQTVSRELSGIKSLGRFDDAALPRIAEDAHANDLVGYRLSQATDRIPSRWSDAEQRTEDLIARDKALDALAAKRARGLPVSQAEEDAVRYSVQLSSGNNSARDAIRDSLIGNSARDLVSRLPGGKLLASGLGAASGVGIAEHIVSHGIGGLIGHAVAPLAATGIAARIVKAAFRDPHVGGLIAANAASVLNSTGVLSGARPGTSTDPSRALRDLADRARSVTPQQASSAAVASLSHVAGSSPMSLAKAGQAAANRHSQFLAVLDRVDPPVTTAGQAMLGRPLPGQQGAREVADFVRMAGSPTNFVVAALQGRLTPGMMAKAESVWPATVERVRQQLGIALSQTAGRGLTPVQRRTVEVLLGSKGTIGAQRSAAYAQAMQASIKPPGGGGQAPKAGSVKTVPVPASPVERASNPGNYR